MSPFIKRTAAEAGAISSAA